MNIKMRSPKKCVSAFICRLSVISMLIMSFLLIAQAQKKPSPLKSDADTDDRVLCRSEAYRNSEYCYYYKKYNGTNASATEKSQARNDMIDLLTDQIDNYYKGRKDSRKTTNAWLQTIFDILEVGASTAISIVNGTRPKTVIADALTGFKTGRNAFNKNFDLLQTQILINKMNSNRDTIRSNIIRKRSQSPLEYSWYLAKSDLRQYLYAGTFSDALDKLVEQTGQEAATARLELTNVALSPPSTKAETDLANLAQKTLGSLQDQNKNGTKTEKDAAVKKLQKILSELEKDNEVKVLLDATGVKSTETDGTKLLDALVNIRRAARNADPPKIKILNKINQTIADSED